jgi:hypothetical protein
MHGSWKKTGGRLGRRTSNGKRLFDADTFCSKFPQRESIFFFRSISTTNRHIISKRLIAN